jgi:hypothetical protein
VLGIVDQHVSLMSSALLHDLPRYRAVTERWHWNGTPEKQVMESVEAALRKILNVSDQAAIDAQLKAVTAALYGRVGADKVVSRIRTEIRNGALTEEKLSSVLEIVQMSLGNKDIRDLFMDFQIWNIYEFTLLEEDKAKAGGEKPLSLEEQIERFTGKSRSIDAMRNTMKSGTADQKITLAGDLNKTSKALMGLHFPEVVKLEENKGIGIRNFYNSYIRPLFSVLSSAMARRSTRRARARAKSNCAESTVPPAILKCFISGSSFSMRAIISSTFFTFASVIVLSLPASSLPIINKLF